MRVVRSWPETVPDGRNYVVDTLERFVMRDYSYRGLGDLDDDVLLIEWDMAVSREDLLRFVAQIEAEPERVHVAPYLIYMETEYPVSLNQPVYGLRRYNDGEASMRFIDESDTHCHLFPLGVTYMPRDIIRDFLDAWPGLFTDGSFSGWHYRNVTQEVPIAWDVRPVHLHYDLNSIGGKP